MVSRRKMDALIRTRTGLKVISLSEIAKIPKKDWSRRASTAARPVSHVPIRAGVENVVKYMEKSRSSIVPVFDGQRLVGVVDRLDIERAIKIMDSLETSP
jgi:CBS domain-containing protein